MGRYRPINSRNPPLGLFGRVKVFAGRHSKSSTTNFFRLLVTHRKVEMLVLKWDKVDNHVTTKVIVGNFLRVTFASSAVQSLQTTLWPLYPAAPLEIGLSFTPAKPKSSKTLHFSSKYWKLMFLIRTSESEANEFHIQI